MLELFWQIEALTAVVRASGNALAPPTPSLLLHPLKAAARLRMHSDARVSAGVIGMYVAPALRCQP